VGKMKVIFIHFFGGEIFSKKIFKEKMKKRPAHHHFSQDF